MRNLRHGAAHLADEHPAASTGGINVYDIRHWMDSRPRANQMKDRGRYGVVSVGRGSQHLLAELLILAQAFKRLLGCALV